MSKYIDRDKLAEFARHSTIGIDANDIMRFPTADVVEVVRCKDCKYVWKHENGCYECGYGFCEVKENFYCADGERKETE